MMEYIRIIQTWCWCLLVLVRSIHSHSSQINFVSFCNQSLNMSSSSSLSITYRPSSHPSCCYLTLVKSTVLSDLSEQITLNILNMSQTHPALQIYNKDREVIKLDNYLSSARTSLQSDVLGLPITFSLCQFDIQPFEILITKIFKGPCKSNQYRCLTTNEDHWCIDETYHCDGFYSCPQGTDEQGCAPTIVRIPSHKVTRTIRGGIVTTIIIIGLLLIVASVSIALAFVLRRRRERRRQFTYSLESTSDDWESSSTGYHLFDTCSRNRRQTDNNLDTVIIDANEHVPIATNMTNR